MKTLLRSILLLNLLACMALSPTACAQNAPQSTKETPMDQSMKRMATAFKNLGKALKAPDAAQQETYIQWAATIKTEAVKCKDFVPVKISEMPAAQQAPVLKDYQKDMDAFIVSAGVLEKALQEKRWADADAAMKVLGKEKSSGHKQFQKGE